MDKYRIERDVMIEAPVDLVWHTITEPDQIVLWFADRVELDLEPGGSGYLVFEDEHRAPVVVEDVEPPTHFSFRWNHPAGEQPLSVNSVLVEFTLTPRGAERTHLRVVESGLELLVWPDPEKERYATEHDGGWAHYLGRLARLLADRPTR
jgi:uncharacterized protein YndB with AHSA1/START domain